MNTLSQRLSRPRNYHAFGMGPAILVLAVLILTVGRPAPAAAAIIDFENEPSLPAQPDNFAAAGAMKSYSKPGVYTITGGVVLGNPTFLPAFAAHGSKPNLYGTTDIADPSLLFQITLTFPSAEHVVKVTGLLFNGQPTTQSYEIAAFSDTLLVAGNIFDMAEDFNSGFDTFSLSSTTAMPITSVEIRPSDSPFPLNGWDFFVDTIEITTISNIGVPEPSTALLFLSGALGLLIVRRPKICG